MHDRYGYEQYTDYLSSAFFASGFRFSTTGMLSIKRWKRLHIQYVLMIMKVQYNQSVKVFIVKQNHSLIILSEMNLSDSTNKSWSRVRLEVK